MKLEITYEKENPLFKRKEIVAYASDIKHTPSKDEVKKEIASKTKAKEDSISIEQIFQLFGGSKAKVKAKIYADKETLTKTEKILKQKVLKAEAEKAAAEKKAAKEAAAQAQQQAEAPKEEAPVEKAEETKENGKEGNKE